MNRLTAKILLLFLSAVPCGCMCSIPISNEGKWKKINGGDLTVSPEKRELIDRYIKAVPHIPEDGLAQQIADNADGAVVAKMAWLYGRRESSSAFPVPESKTGLVIGYKSRPYEKLAEAVIERVRSASAVPALRELISNDLMVRPALFALRESGTSLTRGELEMCFRRAWFGKEWEATLADIETLPRDVAGRILLSYFSRGLIHPEKSSYLGGVTVGDLIACQEPDKRRREDTVRGLDSHEEIEPFSEKEYARLLQVITVLKKVDPEGLVSCLRPRMQFLSAAQQSERAKLANRPDVGSRIELPVHQIESLINLVRGL